MSKQDNKQQQQIPNAENPETFTGYSIIETLAGWPKALAIAAIVFCLTVKTSVFVAPITLNVILQYYDISVNTHILLFSWC